MLQEHFCTFKKQLQKEKLDNTVAKVISKLVSSPKFADMMQKKINMKVDTTESETEILELQKWLKQYISTQRSLEKQKDSLDIEDGHYDRKLSDLQDRLDKMYDNIDNMEKSIAVSWDRKKAIEAEKLTGDNVYKVLIYFDNLYEVMEDADKRNLLSALIDEIQVYEEEQANEQQLKSIGFKQPNIDSKMDLSLDNDDHVET